MFGMSSTTTSPRKKSPKHTRLPIRLARTFLEVLGVAFCLGGFGWLVWKQTLNFYQGKTGVSVSYQQVTQHEVPILFFCPARPFEGNSSWLLAHDPAAYTSFLRPLVVEFEGYVTQNYVFVSVEEESGHHRMIQLDTFYNGRCHSFSYNRTLGAGEYLRFALSHPVDLFILQPGDEVFMLWGTWGTTSPAMLTVERISIVQLYTSRHRYLEGSAGCDDRVGAAECVHRMVEEKLEEADQCVSYQLKQFFPQVKNRVCSPSEGETALATSFAVVTMMGVARRSCRMPCRQTSHRAQAMPYADLNAREGALEVLLSFPSNLERSVEQFVIYDAAAIVAAFGGGMGLFLGFSCMTLFNKALQIMDRIWE